MPHIHAPLSTNGFHGTIGAARTLRAGDGRRARGTSSGGERVTHPGGRDDRRHLLTVVHSAERTGPPVFALRFLRWLREARPDWTLSTLSLGGGTELLDDFAALGPTLVASPAASGRGGRARRVASSLTNARTRAQLQRHGRIDVAHVHCVGSMRALDVMSPATPVLCHVHELSVGLELHLGPRAAARLGSARRYVAVADCVREQFLERADVPAGLVERQWGFVDPADLPAPPPRTELGLAEDAVVVLSSGVRHWRKAPELFVRIARAAVAARPDLPWQFVWVGGADVGGLQALVRTAGLDDVVRFVDHRPDSLRWVAAADVFLLPAREDAFPLVCVEAAALGRPVVTYDNGGAGELVANGDCGLVVPFADLDRMVDGLANLADRPDERRRLGANGREFVARELTIATAGPALLASLEAVLADGRR
jgi:glycosyltransferase involved in cell wall biosynthesis